MGIVSDIQGIINEKDIGLDTGETMSERVMQRSAVFVIIVGMSAAERCNADTRGL